MTAGLRAATREKVQQIVRPPSLTAMIIDQIRDLIITGELEMGEKLSENSLAARLGVSRTPVREACLKLQTERLVEVRPQRGIFVFTCDVSQIHDLCEMRQVIETASMRLGMKRNPKSLLRNMGEMVVAGRQVIHSPTDYQPTDHGFHLSIVSASENRELIEAYDGVSGRSRALRYRYARTQDEVKGSHADHETIYRMLSDGDIEGAVTLLSSHVYGSLHNVEKIMEQISDHSNNTQSRKQ